MNNVVELTVQCADGSVETILHPTPAPVHFPFVDA